MFLLNFLKITGKNFTELGNYIPERMKEKLSKMQIRWKTLLAKTLIWLAAEIALNSIVLDILTDHSKLVFDRSESVHLR